MHGRLMYVHPLPKPYHLTFSLDLKQATWM